MSKILYYSNFCENCKKLLQNLAKSQEKKDMHFICIDSRIQKNNKTYIVLQNGQEILLPPQVNRVPALLFLNQKEQNIIFGEEIHLFESDFPIGPWHSKRTVYCKKLGRK